ncbi:MAG: glycosyltransferase [Gemmatimonadetes bacterium]|nr:glycosyltransferase [Gemmatimonadota bacterium]
MRILWAKAGKILPVDTGGKIRSINILRQLARRHEVVYLSYYGGPRDPRYDEALRTEFPLAITMSDAWPGGAVGQGLKYAGGFLSGGPFAVRKFTDAAVRAKVGELYRSGGLDVAVCDFLSASGNFPERLTRPSVLFQHNVESALWRRQAEHPADAIRGLIYPIEARRMLAYEAAAVKRFHHVIAVSAHDRDQMVPWTRPERVSVTPTGVDVDTFAAGAGDAGQARPLVVFVGSMDWEANADGIDWFCRESWPRIAAQRPDAVLRVVGRNPPARIRELVSDRVQVTGTVPSVVEHLHEAAVVIVPLRVGGGTRLKIFEAMAARRPVVSTTVGAEGLDVRHGEDIVLADEATSVADAIIGLLADPAARTRIGDAAAATAARFGWPAVTRDFEAALEQARVDAAG